MDYDWQKHLTLKKGTIQKSVYDFKFIANQKSAYEN